MSRLSDQCLTVVVGSRSVIRHQHLPSLLFVSPLPHDVAIILQIPARAFPSHVSFRLCHKIIRSTSFRAERILTSSTCSPPSLYTRLSALSGHIMAYIGLSVFDIVRCVALSAFLVALTLLILMGRYRVAGFQSVSGGN